MDFLAEEIEPRFRGIALRYERRCVSRSLSVIAFEIPLSRIQKIWSMRAARRKRESIEQLPPYS